MPAYRQLSRQREGGGGGGGEGGERGHSANLQMAAVVHGYP